MEEQKWTTIVTSDKKINIDIKGLRKSWDLILLWVRRIFVTKYKQTVLGPAWAIIQPFFTTIVFSLIFGRIASLGAPGVPDFIFYLSGTIIWTLFANCLTQNSSTFVSNAGIMGKVYFPRLVMPIATAISQFITFGIQFAFMIIFLLYYYFAGVHNGVTYVNPNICIALLPLILVQTAILGTGCGIIISSLTTKYRDLTMLVGFGVSLWQYASPIAYDMFNRRALYERRTVYYFYMLNPVTPIVNLFRTAFIGNRALDWVDWTYYGISWIFTIIIAGIGILMFSKVEKTFMDTV